MFIMKHMTQIRFLSKRQREERKNLKFIQQRTWSPGRRWLANAHVPKKGSEFASCFGRLGDIPGRWIFLDSQDTRRQSIMLAPELKVGCSLSNSGHQEAVPSSSLPMEIPTTIYNFYNLINLPDVTMAFWGEVSHPIQWMNTTQEVWSSVVAD